jgi:mycofactocin system glycosyltransferase
VNAPRREDGGALDPILPAPDRASTPLPGTFGLTIDTSTVAFDDGRVLMGGSPPKLLRLSARARTVAQGWAAGKVVGERGAERSLARRLVASGLFVPRPGPSSFGPKDVTVVVPVRNRPAQLERLLASLEGLACIVVDDASADAAGTRRIAETAGAAVVSLLTNSGPSAARNAGLSRVRSPLVAFVDSDCVPADGWLEPLLGHFDDPLVAAVAPRIVPLPVAPATVWSRYEADRSSLDRGDAAGIVRPLSRIPYVFDPALRGGEDVDAVWRMVGAGWDVRYEPRSTVRHDGPVRAGAGLARRTFYGTTAGPLALRHGTALAPLHTSVWTAGVWALVAARRPVPALGTLAVSVAVLARRLRGLVDRPVLLGGRIAGGGTLGAALPALGGLVRAWAPGLLFALSWRRTRRAATLALLLPAIGDAVTARADLDPLRYAALHAADDLAYGAGVWLGCARARTLVPLLPRIAFRTRRWSSPSLQAALGGRAGG